MNRHEAIKRGRDLYQDPYFQIAEEDRKAIKLGTEAIQIFNIITIAVPAFRDAKLPSETEE